MHDGGQAAVALLEEMTAAGSVPNTTTFNSVINAFAQACPDTRVPTHGLPVDTHLTCI